MQDLLVATDNAKTVDEIRDLRGRYFKLPIGRNIRWGESNRFSLTLGAARDTIFLFQNFFGSWLTCSSFPLIDPSAEQGQRAGDELRAKLDRKSAELGYRASALPRLFDTSKNPPPIIDEDEKASPAATAAQATQFAHNTIAQQLGVPNQTYTAPTPAPAPYAQAPAASFPQYGQPALGSAYPYGQSAVPQAFGQSYGQPQAYGAGYGQSFGQPSSFPQYSQPTMPPAYGMPQHAW